MSPIWGTDGSALLSAIWLIGLHPSRDQNLLIGSANRLAATKGTMMKNPKNILAVLVLSAGLTAGLAAGTATLASAHDLPQQHHAIESTHETASYGLIINVTNNSTHNMRWMGDLVKQPSNTPKAVLRPGETDRLVYKGDSAGMSARPQYQVDDTQYSVYPVFSVPLVGPNGYVCSVNDMSSYDSPVGATNCKIGSGWEPDAHFSFVNRTPR
jgi:hypothetical protein